MSDAGSASPPSDDRVSIGRYLAAQRKLRGISLDELATRTRIPRRNLERLESGAFDGQPDGFVRGFVRTVAEALGLDPREAVMRLVGEPVAADEEWLRVRRRRFVAAAVAFGSLVLLALGWGVRETVRWIREPKPAVADEWVYRRDPVRALAEQVAAEAADPAAVETDDPAAVETDDPAAVEAPGESAPEADPES